MGDFIAVYLTSDQGGPLSFLFVMMLTFTLSTLLAFVYRKTFRGLSYSRNYIQTIILISIVTAIVVRSVGDSLAFGIGMIAAMSVIRFRTNFKDPRDTLFLFASMATGIACGAYAFDIAIIGNLFFSGAAILLYYSPMGPNNYYDGLLRFNTVNDANEEQKLKSVMARYCKTFALVTLREIDQGHRMDYAYHIKLKNGMTHEKFLNDLRKLEHIQGVNLMLQESTVDL
ncbi:MAG: DUF4956 domain-containing protein [Alphaproteobacteria bacterium]|nr:DUF4956 domain-containing protein [Alphaproteobacteria bacterium]